MRKFKKSNVILMFVAAFIAVVVVFNFAGAQDVFNLVLQPRQTFDAKCEGGGDLVLNRPFKLADGSNDKTAGRLRCKPAPAPGEPTPTPEPVEPTPTPEPIVPTPMPPASDTMILCHSQPMAHDGLNVHEHGDCPPDWANQFSMANFGHPVIYGGDEATPNENTMKHQAYKGFLTRMSGVDLFIRHHSQSNPHGRSAAFHSYEVYARDNNGNVSMWQGWQFYGYPERRDQRMTRRHEVAGVDGFPGRDQFIIASPDRVDWDNYLRCEQWYGHGGYWSWDLSITICGASTLFAYDEHLTDVTNMSTWVPTGDVGGGRRIEATNYGPGNPLVRGIRTPVDAWYCVSKQPREFRSTGDDPLWDITSAVSGPNACPDGYLPQYKASTYPAAGVYFQTGNTDEKEFNTNGVTLPN